MKVKNDHRSIFSNLSNWKEEEDSQKLSFLKNFFPGFFFPIASIGKYTAMIILHFYLQPQFIYELFRIYIEPQKCELFSITPLIIQTQFSSTDLSSTLCQGERLELPPSKPFLIKVSAT